MGDTGCLRIRVQSAHSFRCLGSLIGTGLFGLIRPYSGKRQLCVFETSVIGIGQGIGDTSYLRLMTLRDNLSCLITVSMVCTMNLMILMILIPVSMIYTMNQMILIS